VKQAPDAMRKKRRDGRITTETSIEDEIVHLRGLDLKVCARGGRACCKATARLFAAASAVCDHRLSDSSRSLGDLDHETRQLLGRTGTNESGTAMSTRLVTFDQKRTQ